MAVTWLDWFSWTRYRLQRETFKLENQKLPDALKTPEGAMRILTIKMSDKALEARRAGIELPEFERFLSILFPYFLPLGLNADNAEHPIRNMRIEPEAVHPLIELNLGKADVSEWLDLCHEHPLIYIDLPMNSWMIAENVQVSAIFSDNGVSDTSMALFFDDEPRSTISVLLAQRNGRSKRRLVWSIRTERWHDDLLGKDVDDLEGQIPTAAAMIEESGMSIVSFCRSVERMIAAALFQTHSLRAAERERCWVAPLPKDQARQLAMLRQDRGEDIRSLFRIERIGIVPREARDRLPPEAVRGSNGPLLSPHWVRGHWRNQRYGPRLSQTKEVWIKKHQKGPAEGQPRHSMALVENPSLVVLGADGHA